MWFRPLCTRYNWHSYWTIYFKLYTIDSHRHLNTFTRSSIIRLFFDETNKNGQQNIKVTNNYINFFIDLQSTYTEWIYPICLPNPMALENITSYIGSSFIVSGWSFLRSGGTVQTMYHFMHCTHNNGCFYFLHINSQIRYQIGPKDGYRSAWNLWRVWFASIFRL